MKKKKRQKNQLVTGEVAPKDGFVYHFCLNPHEGKVVFLSRDAKWGKVDCHDKKPKRYRQFINGAAKLFDFGGGFNEHYVDAPSEKDADSNALRADWGTVGADLYNALVFYDRAKSK